MQLAEVVPWGRSLPEYRQMFNLTAVDLDKRILGCGDGPASFNTELTQLGGQVVSVDPLYQFSRDQIAEQVKATSALVLEQVRRNRQQFVWHQIASLEQLAELRHRAMSAFLADYPPGLTQGRYLAAQLPELPFTDQSIDLALCSHLLFLYSEQLPLQMHLDSIGELCRVAAEVRVYPLLELTGRKSRHLATLLPELEKQGYQVSLEQVGYQFQKGADQLLKLRRPV